MQFALPSRVVNYKLATFPFPLGLHLPQRILLQGFGSLYFATLSNKKKGGELSTMPQKPTLPLLGFLSTYNSTKSHHRPLSYAVGSEDTISSLLSSSA